MKNLGGPVDHKPILKVLGDKENGPISIEKSQYFLWLFWAN